MNESRLRQAIAFRRRDEMGVSIESCVSLEAFVQIRSGVEFAEKFEQRPWAEAMETAGQVQEAFAWETVGNDWHGDLSF